MTVKTNNNYLYHKFSWVNTIYRFSIRLVSSNWNLFLNYLSYPHIIACTILFLLVSLSFHKRLNKLCKGMFPLWYASLVLLKRTELSRLSGADIDFSV